MSRPIRRIDVPGPRLLGPDAESFLEGLAGPVVFRIPGRDPTRVRAVTTLLHGNEPSGARAVRQLLLEGFEPAVDALCFLGSVRAALAPPRFTYRSVPGEPDLNRRFRLPFDGPVGAVARELLDELQQCRPEALVDLHNTSGSGPSYSVCTRQTPRCEQLTSLFAPHMVLTDLRLGTLIEATEALCPSVVVECGGARDAVSDRVALAGLRRFLGDDPLFTDPPDPPPRAAPEVFRHPFRVELAPDATLAVHTAPVPGADLTLPPDLDRHNFGLLEPEETLGWLGPRGLTVVQTHAGAPEETERLFADRGGRMVARRRLRPLMITTDPAIARTDCLFYVVDATETTGGNRGD